MVRFKVKNSIALFLISIPLLLLLSSCGNNGKGVTDIKVQLKLSDLSTKSDQGYSEKAIPIGDIKYIALSYSGPLGKGYEVVPIKQSSEVSLTLPNGPTKFGVWVFTSSTVFYDSVFNALSGGTVTLNFSPIEMGISPYKVGGTVTVKNESNVTVSNQKIGLKSDAWRSGTTNYIYKTTTSAAGVFTYSVFARESDYTIDVLDDNDKIMKSIPLITPAGASDFTTEIGFNVTSAFCRQNTTVTSCSQTGCIWLNEICEAESTFTCSNLSESDCKKNPACYFNIANFTCIRTSAISCNSKTVTECTGACVWDTSANLCVNSSTINCSSYVTSATCKSPCYFDTISGAGVCRNSMTTSCSTNTTQTTCNSTAACFWNSSGSGSCQNAMAFDCAINSTIGTCQAQANCFWNSSESKCKNSIAIDCSSYSSTTCSTSGGGSCMWDSTLNKCINTMAVDCSAAVTQPTCITKAGCSWNSTNSSCVRLMGNDCGSLTSQTCSSTTGCYWSGTSCISSLGAACGSKTSSTACNSDSACFWNSISGSANGTCVNRSTFNCSSYITSPTCVSPCVWNGSSCQNGASAGCSTITNQTTCYTSTICTWNTISNICRERSYACSIATQSSACIQELGCEWVNSLSTCKPKAN